MQTAPDRHVRDQAWTATKLAVREYSRDPSETNESQVRAACSRLRALSASEAHALLSPTRRTLPKETLPKDK